MSQNSSDRSSQQPPQDERGQGSESIVSKTASNTEPRLVESFPIEVKIDPNANKGSITISQPVALSTLTEDQAQFIAASQDSAKETK